MEIMDGGDVSMGYDLTVGNMHVRQDGTNYYLGHSGSAASNTQYAVRQESSNGATYINTGGSNLRFAQSGTVKMVMDADGLALNNANAPTDGYKLDVVGDVLFQNDLDVDGDVSMNGKLQVFNSGSTFYSNLTIGGVDAPTLFFTRKSNYTYSNANGETDFKIVCDSGALYFSAINSSIDDLIAFTIHKHGLVRVGRSDIENSDASFCVEGDVSFNSNLAVAGEISANTLAIGSGYTEFSVDSAGATSIASTLEVDGDVSFGSNLAVAGTLDVSNTLSLGPIDATYGGEIVFNPDSDNNQTYYANVKDDVFGIRTSRDATGNGIYLKPNGQVGIGKTNPSSKLHVQGSARIEGGLTVTSNLVVNGIVTDNNSELTINDGLEVTGDVSMNSNLAVAGEISANTLMIGSNYTEFTVDSAGATSIASTLEVDGDVSLNSNLAVVGTAYATDISAVTSFKVGNTSITDGNITIKDASFGGDVNVLSLYNTLGSKDNSSASIKYHVSSSGRETGTISNYRYGSQNYGLIFKSLIPDPNSPDALLFEHMVLRKGGVGIGTTNPGYKLHVVGTAYATDISAGTSIKVGQSIITTNTIPNIDSSINTMESKLDNIEDNANNYSLPTASDTALGGVIVGNNISLSNTGVISIPQAIGANNNPTFNNLTLTGKITLTGGDITSNTDNAFLGGEDSLLTLNGFMYAKAILNYNETGSGTTGVVFGTGSSYGTDEISFITSGDTQMFINDNGVGIGTNNPSVTLDIGSSDAIRIPRGSTAQRPSTTTVGMIRYNTTTTEYEAWYGGSTTGEWSSLGGTSSVATTSADGLMSSSDKSKLDNIESGANVTDAANVSAAGAVMTSGSQSISDAKTFSDLRLNNEDFLRLYTSSNGGPADRYSIGMSKVDVNGKGFSSWATKFRMADNATQGFLFTNDSSDCLVSIRASDGLTYINGNTGIGFDPTEASYSSYKLSVNGTTYTTGLNANTINIGTNNTEFTVASDGATSIASTLNVNGKTTIDNALDVTRDVSFSDTMRVYGNVGIGKGSHPDYALDISGEFRLKSKNFNAIRLDRNSSDNDPYVIIGDGLNYDDDEYTWGASVSSSSNDSELIRNYEFDRTPLHVGDGYSTASNNFWKLARLTSAGSNSTSSFTTQIRFSIISKESILIGGDGVYIYSDKRIKNNIQTIDDNQALLDFRKLNPCTYSYIDNIHRGNKTVYGFIAQEVEKVLPYACRARIGTVPNVYGFATVSVSGKRLTLTMSSFNNLETTDASNNPIPIILKLANDKKTFYINAESVIDEMNVELNEPLLFEDCVFDDSLNEYVIFIYGQKVNNFKALDKNAIWTVTAAATQEIDRQQQADKVRIAELETKVETLESQLASVLARLTALENA